MLRHSTKIDSGIIVCWFINMFLNWEIGAVALGLWCISLWFHVSWYPAAVVAGIWVLGTLLFTLFFGWILGQGKPHKGNRDLPNVNPYSYKNNTSCENKEDEQYN